MPLPPSARTSGGSPGPWSATARRMRPSGSRSQVTRTSPLPSPGQAWRKTLVRASLRIKAQGTAWARGRCRGRREKTGVMRRAASG